jgi:hypothetical protein
MNEARQIYLTFYGRIDSLDTRVTQCKIFYRTWKYWHGAKNHATGVGQAVAYDMCLECAKEKRAREYFGIGDGEKFHILDFKEFRRKQSTICLAYDPVDCAFDGDARMRSNTEKPIAKRKL